MLSKCYGMRREAGTQTVRPEVSKDDRKLAKIFRHRMLLAPSQAPNLHPVPSHQRFLLRPTPTLDLPFRSQRFLSRRKFLRPDQLHRSSRSRIPRNRSLIMHSNTTFEIVRVPDVVAFVHALQHVRPETHAAQSRSTRKSTSPSDTRARNFESASTCTTERTTCPDLRSNKIA